MAGFRQPECNFESETEKRIDEQGVGFTEVRNIWILNSRSKKILPILERHFEVSKPHPRFHKWQHRRKGSIYFSVVYPFVYPSQISFTTISLNN